MYKGNYEIRQNIFDKYQNLKMIDPENNLLKYFEVKYKKTKIGKIKNISFIVNNMKEFFQKYQSKTLNESYNLYINSLEDQIKEHKYAKNKKKANNT